MAILQLSVFLENKTGRINEVCKVLAKNDINMHAFSMAESSDFGILRLIVSDKERAVQVLREADFAVKLTEVACISCPNVPGALSEVLDLLAKHDIFIEYMYAFAQGEWANTVIKPTELARCETLLREAGWHVVDETQLG